MNVPLFQTGDFTLASGQKSCWKIECDALTPDDWAGLAAMLSELLHPFGAVEGVPRGGLPLAKALSPYVSDLSAPPLVVDDVWTTGGSMKAHLRGRTLIRGAVVFARNPVPSWVTALFQMAP